MEIKHRCGVEKYQYIKISWVCEEYADMRSYKCYIQPEQEEERKWTKSEERKARIARLVKEWKELGEEDLIFKDPSISVYADYENMQDEEGEDHVIPVCRETDGDEATKVFYGKNCSDDLNYLDELVVNEDGFEQSVIVLFHNLKGYDEIFVLQELY